MASPPNGTPFGFLTPADTWGKYAQVRFAVMQALELMQTSSPVRVESCTNDGGISPVGFVNVTPLVNQVDALGNPTPHGIINNIPYMRVQGGANAIIMDPKPGDIGICVFASRDISAVKNNKAQSNPGSFRTYDFSDGMYLGGLLNGVPTQYILFGSTGISLVSPTKISMIAPTVEIDASTEIILNGQLSQGNGSNGGTATMLGPVTVTHDVTAAGISVSTHVHGGVQSGGSDTGGPI